MLNQSNGALFFAGLVTGGLVGVGLALLLAPRPGEETRTQLKVKGLELKGQAEKSLAEAGHHAQEQAVVWQQKGKEILERGKQSAAEAIDHGKDNLVEALSHGKDNLVEAISHRRNNVVESVAA